MKNILIALSIIFLISCDETTVEPVINETIIDVDPNLFLTDGLVTSITTETQTLSNGEQASCYKIITKNKPTDHKMGPWCPSHISDDASLGGIWMEHGELHDVDGAFVENMHIFYDDNTWKMYDANGNIYITNTQQKCEAAANPNVGPEYQNYCVECLPSYVTDITNTYYIPITPQELTPVSSDTTLDDCGGHYDEIRGYHYHVADPGSNSFFGCSGNNAFKGAYQQNEGGPPGGGGPAGSGVRGLAFNGVRFDAPAPVDRILGAYTLAPLDDAGGHINLHAGYHYHAATGKTEKIGQGDNHPAMIGYAMDGFGIYAQLDSIGNAN